MKPFKQLELFQALQVILLFVILIFAVLNLIYLREDLKLSKEMNENIGKIVVFDGMMFKDFSEWQQRKICKILNETREIKKK